ncbi:MAG TPA: 3-deoxy-D-manno-octulosonic acid kinase [Dokdonella sp.]|uniref:3-deoxy-D-manno-octulosonic acid kinase n=1 Tax=Dokdonella sp. TaxID=2291710 RepID=UPI002D7E1A8F|nr:3-deoxy-D-manno-octulosonic acid kinase [Dokdonella sp.]HET9033682.1 3-deoxy-D-manno-octulosonic acid kinase [Dokdonella sp.]
MIPQVMIKAQIQATANGAILFDSTQMAKADERWFEQAASGDAATRAGRGEVVFFDAPFGACVLRHYHRGGLIARVNSDRFLWTGSKRCRAFREFRLLVELIGAGLPVPTPVMARYVRKGLSYRADLITRQIPGVQTLAQRLAAKGLDAVLATRVGRTLASFHSQGVWHADLNANNLLVDGGGKVWLIDFDRCAKRKPAMTWQQANLQRLLRSFRKLQAGRHMSDFDEVFWHPMLAAYHRSLADRYARGEIA